MDKIETLKANYERLIALVDAKAPHDEYVKAWKAARRARIAYRTAKTKAGA